MHLLERHRYSERPPRYEYVLTERGRDFRSVIVAMQAWGNKHFAPEGPSVLLVNAETGATVDPVMIDRATGRLLIETELRLAPGPAARERTRRRLASSAWNRPRPQADSTPPPAKRTARKSTARL